MLKTETLNIIEFNNGHFKKPVLIRYTIIINSKEPQSYDEDAISLISFLKSLPEEFDTIEFYYNVADSKTTGLVRQKIMIKVNQQFYSCYTLDDDLDLFFNVLSLFKTYEYEVDGFERSISPLKLDEFLATYKF